MLYACAPVAPAQYGIRDFDEGECLQSELSCLGMDLFPAWTVWESSLLRSFFYFENTMSKRKETIISEGTAYETVEKRSFSLSLTFLLYQYSNADYMAQGLQSFFATNVMVNKIPAKFCFDLEVWLSILFGTQSGISSW